MRRLILAGPRERTAEFRRVLPNELKDRVVAEEHVDLGAPEGELIDRLEAIREQAEHEREKELLAEIRERGVRGPDETIAALQEQNRVYHLAALWDLEGEIRWCDNDHLAIRDITAKECPYCGRKTRLRPWSTSWWISPPPAVPAWTSCSARTNAPTHYARSSGASQDLPF